MLTQDWFSSQTTKKASRTPQAGSRRKALQEKRARSGLTFEPIKFSGCSSPKAHQTNDVSRKLARAATKVAAGSKRDPKRLVTQAKKAKSASQGFSKQRILSILSTSVALVDAQLRETILSMVENVVVGVTRDVSWAELATVQHVPHFPELPDEIEFEARIDPGTIEIVDWKPEPWF